MTNATEQEVLELLALEDAGARDPAVAGGKAAVLARLLESGYAVPAGYVLPVSTCDRLVEGVAAPGDVLADGAPTALRERLAAVLEDLGGGPVAVRSSAVAEDLAEASYAGQYETVLGVADLDGVVDAVRTCIISAYADRVAAYAGGEPGPAGMAVLIQRQIDPEAAGVAFSANPVTGDRDETLVSAVAGLGDRLASGEATPDEWVVRPDGAERRADPENAIDEEQACRVAALAEELERLLGEPQDVEWAIADGQVLPLQSRPITALPVRPDLDLPSEGTWTKDQAHYPELMTPFGASVYLPALDAGITAMLRRFGLLLDRLESRSIGGEIYGHVVPVGGKEGPPPPWWVLAIVSRIVPPLRARMKTAERVLREGRLDEAVTRWEQQWRGEFEKQTASLQDVDLADLDDPDLEAHLDEAIELLEHGQHVHFHLFAPYFVYVHELVRAGEELLGWTPIQAMDLVAGLSEASSGPARAMADLAARIRSHPELDELEDDAGRLLTRLRRTDPALGEAFDEYVRRYAHRAVNYDPGAPTLAERPQLLVSLLRDTVHAEEEDVAARLAERRREAEDQASRALADRPADRARFEQALSAAQRVYPLREDNIFWTDNLPSGLIRRALVEVGHRLVGRGQLRHPGDVAFLKVDEVRSGLHDETLDLSDRAARRRAERAWVAAHPGPAYLGDEPSDMPDVRGLPAAGRRINEAMIWFFGQEYSPPVPTRAGGIDGIPGSPGRYTGPVRIVTSEAEFDRVRPGDVLVCPITTPVWSVLFGQVGAVVTDGGGTLSHAAIVAREHGIPAVLATGDGTSRLSNGQVVTVDGAAGTVSFADQD